MLQFVQVLISGFSWDHEPIANVCGCFASGQTVNVYWVFDVNFWCPVLYCFRMPLYSTSSPVTAHFGHNILLTGDFFNACGIKKCIMYPIGTTWKIQKKNEENYNAHKNPTYCYKPERFAVLVQLDCTCLPALKFLLPVIKYFVFERCHRSVMISFGRV